MLAQFALTAFVLLAMLSLVIDVGYARLTQVQMQSAADSTALEGLRLRDSRSDITNTLSASASDCARRAAANRLVRRVFDDDLDPSNGDPDYQFGAGPIIDVTDGATNLHALAMLSAPDAHSYKPDLQLNQQNEVHGDFVSGRFLYSDDPAASEDATYTRSDFVPNPTPPQLPPSVNRCPASDDPELTPWPAGGSGSLTAGNDTAFLVRMRRSNELHDNEAQTETNVASSGPSLPLVFGRGTTINADDPAGGYSVRRDGVTVRATAIAEVRPALHVGAAQAGMLGAMPFALLDTFVVTTNQVGCNVTVNPITGVILRSAGGSATCTIPVGTVVGRFVANPNAISTVGQALPAASPIPCVSVPPAGFAGYGTVYSVMATSGANRAIGFSRIALGRTAACPVVPTTPFAASVSRGVALVAPSNATAVVTGGLPLPATAQPAEVQEVLRKNLVLPGSINYAPVLVPVLAR